MKTTFFKEHRAILCEEFFTQEEYDEMWFELCNLCTDDLLVNSDKAGGAKNHRGELQRFNRGLFVDSVMDDGAIIKYMNKIFDEKIVEEFVSHDINYKLLEYKDIPQANLINHYMGGHSYGYHTDDTFLTAITVFHKIPKPYDGGVLTFMENDSILELKMNPRDLVVFAGITQHAVSSISLHDNIKSRICKSDEGLYYQKANDPMNGRISVSKFIGKKDKRNNVT